MNVKKSETKPIVNKIKSICKLQNLKISTLLRKADLSANLIDDWQKNKTEPSFPALNKICTVLNIELKDLFKNQELTLTDSQFEILTEWKNLNQQEKQTIFDYIIALKSNH